MTILNERELAMIQNITNSIKDSTEAVKGLAEAIKPDSFHNRQVPALQRQSEALEYLKGERKKYVDSDFSSIDISTGLKIIDKVSRILLST